MSHPPERGSWRDLRRSCAGAGRGDEHGAAALFVVTLAAAVLACTAAVLLGGRLLADHRRAAAAADLAALAGAVAVQHGQAGCPAAERVAVLNDAVVTECHVTGQEVVLEVRTESVRVLGTVARPRADARAGPVG